ncbi:MAG: class I SAM-dependent methyltransferase [Spirochaetales bacterium]|nr:class I SAM-dependent methyltransferase [Spirochaetales bacterium]
MKQNRRVCSADAAPMLDNGFRQWLHPRESISAPYVKKGDTVLDLGCGPGSFTDVLAELAGKEGRVVAVDLQEKMLELMKGKVARRNLSDRVTPHLCRSDSLMIDEYEGKVDFALAFWMAHETPDLSSFLQEVRRSLKGEGRFLCVEPRLHVSRSRFNRMVQTAEEIGFRSEAVKGIRLSRAVLFLN